MRNPFKNPILARTFDQAVEAHAARNKSLFDKDGSEVWMNWAGSAFWRGYHGRPPYLYLKDSMAYAVFKAGAAVAKHEAKNSRAA